jgi:hypothetical protein
MLPADGVPPERRPYGTPDLIILPGQVLREGQTDFVQPFEPHHLSDGIPAEECIPFQDSMDVDDQGLNDVIRVTYHNLGNDSVLAKDYKKKVLQWQRWKNDVIPLLLEPYLAILYSTKFFRNPIPPGKKNCPNSCGRSRLLNVICVSFQGEFYTLLQFLLCKFCDTTNITLIELNTIQIHSCDCLPAVVQLLSFGFFPCAPIAPSLAVSLNMLQFAYELFTRVAPNNTAWSDALEAFLSHKRYTFPTDVSVLRNYLISSKRIDKFSG